MQPPRIAEEQAAIIGDGVVSVQQVLQRGYLGAFRVTAARRLLQLLGVAEQHDVGSRLRHSQDVRQRHLARLVDEQYVDRLGEFHARPQPSGAGGDLYTIGECGGNRPGTSQTHHAGSDAGRQSLA